MRRFATIAATLGLLAAAAGLAAEGEKPAYPSWIDAIKVKGDFRFRHEMIDEEGKDERNRERIRARVEIGGKVNDVVDIGVRLASGAPDPVSTNQTLTESFSSKSFYLDLAYFNWHPSKELSFTGGKVKNPFVLVASDLIWDGDLNPEGLALQYAPKFGSIGLTLNGGGFWIEERSSDSESMLAGVQAAVDFGFGESKLLVGGGYFGYTNTKDFAPFVDPSKGFGNTTYTDPDDNRLYEYDYKLLEAMVQFSTKFGPLPFAVFGDYVVNQDPDDDNTGYLAGFALGKKKDPWSWELAYNYRRLEADAVVGAFTDSDFIGGGTNGKGHKLSAGLVLAKNSELGLTYFLNDKGIESSKDYKRLQLDLAFKF